MKNKKLIIIISCIVAVLVVAAVVFCVYYFSKPKETEMTFVTGVSDEQPDGYEISATIYEPRDDKSSHPVVIIGHGYNSSMDNCADTADYYCDSGYSVIVFDFVGGSRNSSTEYHSANMTPMTEVYDYETVLKYVKESPQFDNNNIFISGQSFGGFIATVTASMNPNDVNALVLFYPAYNMVANSSAVLQSGVTEAGRFNGEYLGELYDWDGLLVSQQFLIELGSFDIENILRGIDKDVLILQGNLDDDVTLESTQYFAPLLPHGKLVIVENGEHGFSGDELKFACESAIEFMNAHLK